MKGIYSLRRALFASFLLLGIAMASWIVRTPSIRDALGASTAEMGLVLFGFSAGSMGAILRAGRLVARFGAARCTLVGLCFVILGLLVLASSTLIATAWVAGLGLALVGVGIAMSEVAINVLGAYVEHQLSRPVLTLVHGCFSLGMAIGSLAGMAILSRDAPVHWHLFVVCGLLVPMVVYVARGVWGVTAGDGAPDEQGQGLIDTLKRDRRLVLIGLIVVAVALAEGSANDWLPLLIVDSHGVPETYGSLAFVAFALTMTVGRFAGPRILTRFGPVVVMCGSGLIGASGILAVIVSPDPYLATAAVVLWAAGAALGFPVAMSAAAANGPDAAARVSALAVIGYTAFLVGPPLLGFLGEHLGLRMAMVVVLALQVFPVFLASNLNGDESRERAGTPRESG